MGRSKNYRRGTKPSGNTNNNFKDGEEKRGKEVEMNVPFTDMNKADLHVKFNKKGKNDLAWYQNLLQMLKDVASLPFGNPAGLSISRIRAGYSIASQSSFLYTSIPGIMTLYFCPTFGNPKQPADAMNLAAQQIYTLDRKANSGATNYDKTDVMMVVGAMDNAYILYEYLLRAYKEMSDFDYLNRYKPAALLLAEGFNYDDLMSNLADFRYMLNTFAYQLAAINIPDQFDIIKRHSWMCSNIYKDSDTDKAQLYVFVPDGLYKYTEGTQSTPTSLQYTKLYNLAGLSTKPTSGFTVQHCATMIANIMNPLMGSQDVGTISGDLAKAFGEGGMIKIQPVAENETISPVYNEEVLHEIQNAQIRNGITPLALKQNLSSLVYGPFLEESFTMVAPTQNVERLMIRGEFTLIPMLSINSDTPTPELSTVATRFMNVFSYPASGNTLTVTSVGTEIINAAEIWYIDQDFAGPITMPITPFYNFGPDANALDAVMPIISGLTKFDWAPSIDFFYVDASTVAYLGDTKDYANYTLLEPETLKEINDVAIMSLWKLKSFS